MSERHIVPFLNKPTSLQLTAIQHGVAFKPTWITIVVSAPLNQKWFYCCQDMEAPACIRMYAFLSVTTIYSNVQPQLNTVLHSLQFSHHFLNLNGNQNRMFTLPQNVKYHRKEN